MVKGRRIALLDLGEGPMVRCLQDGAVRLGTCLACAGLDSTNAAAVVGILAALGGRGVTVVLSIHQPRPDVLRLMDRALILSGFGEVVYSGAPFKVLSS